MRETELTFESDSHQLCGSLIVGSRGGSVALLISGSGPIDRDSNMKRLQIDVMAQVAKELSEVGIGSFRYDKRGVGASEGDYKSCGLFDNVRDARAAVAALRGHLDVDPSRIFVVGHSEGALIATELAAEDSTLAGVVLLAGTASTGDEVLRWQVTQVAQSLPRPVTWILKALRTDLARTQAKRLAKIEASTTDTARVQMVQINAKWLREFMKHDPTPSLRAIRIPVLALAGSKDIQVNPDEVETICQQTTSPCTHRVLDGLTHLLRHTEGPPSVRDYKKQTKQPVDSELLALITAWITDQPKGHQP